MLRCALLPQDKPENTRPPRSPNNFNVTETCAQNEPTFTNER
jgi:hypothetical protein